MSNVDDALAWIDQARSDARTAYLVTAAQGERLAGDVGCHVALLCAQSFEKCIKGCMFLVGQTPTLTHGVETSIDDVLARAGERRARDPRRRLAEIFRARGVRGAVQQLMALMPGNATDVDPNYEYPWRADPGQAFETPYGHALFERRRDHVEWVRVATHVADEVAKVVEAVRRG